ncbi:MAG: hypothetical protein IH988_01325 [Planctomycetes bacterium]|nr:hypothetical protein [Planctomycetota bacterium]
MTASVESHARVSPVRIGNRSVGDGQTVYVIAEAGVNHDGSVETAFRMVVVAAQAGAGNGEMSVCPALERPAVNVGSRQEGRLRAGPSVIDCADSPQSIESAMIRAQRLRLRPGRTGCYGNGCAGVRIAEVLIGTQISDRLRRKPITF